MKKEEVKVRAKGFWERNKLYIAGGAIAGVSVLIGYKWANHVLCVKKGDFVVTDDVIKHMLRDVQTKYGDNHNLTMAWNTFETPLTMDDLGKLGEKMREYCEPNEVDGSNYTHFLAFGPTKI